GGGDGGRRDLVQRAYERLRKLAGTILRQSFPGVQARHEVDSVLSDTWVRLDQALAAARPPTVVDFLRLAAHKVRQVLLDLAERQKRLREHERSTPAGDSAATTPYDPAQSTYDPARLALWTE